MCSLSRYVVIGGFAGVAVATLAGSDLLGGLAAALAVGLTALAMRRRPRLRGACALPASPVETDAPRTDDVPRDHVGEVPTRV